DDESFGVRMAAVRAIWIFGRAGFAAIPALLGYLDTHDDVLASEIVQWIGGRERDAIGNSQFPGWSPGPNHSLSFAGDLRACGTDVPRAIPVLVGALKAEDPITRAIAAWALGDLAIDNPEVQQRILALLDDQDQRVRDTAFSCVSLMPLNDQTIPIIRA